MSPADSLKVEAIDLFCGIGGLTHGLQQSNIKVVAGLDNDATCSYSYEKNNDSQFICADVTKYDFTQLTDLYSKNSIKVLAGCAPCQTFSSHSFKVKNKENDVRWNMIDHFLRAIKILNPDIISMENVRGITKTKIFNQFLQSIESLGYQVSYDVINCADYGVPQSRNRLVLLASKLGNINLPDKTHSKEEYISISAVIKNLPKIQNGQTDPDDQLHKSRNLSPLNLERIRQSKPNGTWRDWEQRLLPECYKKESGQTYSSVYGRMGWEKVSPTITTQFTSYGSGRFGHPEQDRALSIREGSLLQSFPDSYDFGSHNAPLIQICRHIGNAVPPRLGFVIGQEILKHVEASSYG